MKITIKVTKGCDQVDNRTFRREDSARRFLQDARWSGGRTASIAVDGECELYRNSETGWVFMFRVPTAVQA